MSTLLQINTSLNGPEGLSSQLAGEFAGRWQADNPGSTRITRDLGTHPVPHLDAERFAGFSADAQARTPEQTAAAALSDELIAELEATDVIVMGLPMYNFGIPSTLKAYFDHVALAGRTFRYASDGPEGLLTGKRAYVFATRGGRYVGTPLDTQPVYLQQFLAFLGITDVEFVYAEGTAMGEQTRTSAVQSARERIAALSQRAA